MIKGLDGYQAIHEGAAIGAIAPRRQIAVAGQDRAAYLQGLLTNDIQSLAPGAGCYAAWLTPQGRMHTDMHVLASDEMILLDVPADAAGATVEHLDQFIFSEDVRVESFADSLASVWLHGPRAAGVLEHVLAGARGLSAWADYQHGRYEFGGQPVSLARIDQLGVPGYCVYLERSNEAAFESALAAAGAVPVESDALEAARIEAGYPVFGVDMTADTIPLEAGIEARAISFTKGCYVGQEVVIRVLHRGHGRVARKLVALRIAGGRPDRGSKLFSGEREIGLITSAALSPRTGSIALGYVHRDFTSPGAVIQAETRDGRAEAVVTDRPIPGASPRLAV